MKDKELDAAVESNPGPTESEIPPTTPNAPSLEDQNGGGGELVTTRVVLLGASLLLVGTLGFSFLDGMIVPEEEVPGIVSNRNHLVDSFYCAAITLTTVGFGDICPGKNTSIFGKMFLVFFTLSGLGFFCGPMMDLASSWRNQLPGGMLNLASITIGTGVLVFSTLEGMDRMDAIYASVVTGTTIGYGDLAPSSNYGKIAVALYAIASVNVMVILLQPARRFLEQLCRTQAKAKMD